jgi:hypothetical protein
VQVLSLDAGIDFGARGNLQEFDPVGFSPAPDAVSTWSEASTAALMFRLPPLRFDLRFTIEVFPYLGEGRVAQQDCWLFVNGLFAHYQTVREPLEMIFTVARDLFNPRSNRLSFALPHATAPHHLGLGNDLRLLGLAFVKLGVADARSPAPGGAGSGAPGPGGPLPGSAASGGPRSGGAGSGGPRPAGAGRPIAR